MKLFTRRNALSGMLAGILPLPFLFRRRWRRSGGCGGGRGCCGMISLTADQLADLILCGAADAIGPECGPVETSLALHQLPDISQEEIDAVLRNLNDNKNWFVVNNHHRWNDPPVTLV